MAYGDEDEVDWSDGSLNDSLPLVPIKAAAASSRLNQDVQTHHDQDLTVRRKIDEQHMVPCRLPLNPGLLNSNSTSQGPSRVKRTRNSVHTNRRTPSKQDYSNFVLYQASQKAYEATFLNTFVAHALHPERIAQCSRERNHVRPTIEDYLRNVSRDIDCITKKIIWNAHCRTVHLLANDGKHGVPFLDVNAISPEPYSDYGPDNIFSVADRMSELWHRVNEKPFMVQYSTDDYDLDHSVGPLEEIDEVTGTLLRRENFGMILPTGRAVRLPTSKKRKGEHTCGATVREEQTAAPRVDRLTFSQHNSLPAMTRPPADGPHELDIYDSIQASPILSASQHVRNNNPPRGPYAEPVECHSDSAQAPLIHLEEIFSRYSNSIFYSDMIDSPALNESIANAHVEKVQSWRMKLVKDHKQRLTRKWGRVPQTVNRAFMDIEQAVAAAVALGYRPINTNYQERVKLSVTEDSRQLRAAFANQFDETEVTQNIFRTTDIPSTRPTENVTYFRPGMGKENISKRDIHMVLDSEQQPMKKQRTEEVVTARRPTTTASTKRKTKTAKSVIKSLMHSQMEGLHPSGSLTLEQHQKIPPGAYFEPTHIDEKPAWRCGIQHALGYYYNAGDRKACRGCNSNVTDCRKAQMDFYMPSRSYFPQPVPDNLWKPFKPSKTPRKHGYPCHNSIAKDAFWEAITTGATEGEARQTAVDTVLEWLKPKPPPKALTPEPEPRPEPEPDLGPHVSGSKTMEHGQEIPDGYYWDREEEHEEYAWRCDVNHALGRYYLAGDKKSCPGCGSSRKGQGKRAIKDFYLPSGVVVRQEAPGLSNWKPREPKLGKDSIVTHNQMCSKAHYEFLADGYGTEEALKLAVEKVDTELDRRQEEKVKRQEEREDEEMFEISAELSTYTAPVGNDSVNTSQAEGSSPYQYYGNYFGSSEKSRVPKKSNEDDMNDAEMYEVGEYQTSEYALSAQMPENVNEMSFDEESSGSDSE